MGFGRLTARSIAFPHWFPTLLAGAAVIALRPAPRWKFRLRDLMILTTIVGVMVGVVTALGRLAA